jgi:hypothetical protein
MLFLSVVLLLSWWIAGLVLWDAKGECVTFSKPEGCIILERYYLFGIASRSSRVKFELITGVTAVKRGYSDDAHFVLAV